MFVYVDFIYNFTADKREKMVDKIQFESKFTYKYNINN